MSYGEKKNNYKKKNSSWSDSKTIALTEEDSFDDLLTEAFQCAQSLPETEDNLGEFVISLVEDYMNSALGREMIAKQVEIYKSEKKAKKEEKEEYSIKKSNCFRK